MIYKRKAYYHETDQMGIVHHSNYIKWFEEARIYLMQEAGISYKKMEQEGILSPVIGIQCDYKKSVEFDDPIEIKVGISVYNGVKLIVTYSVGNPAGDIIYALGESKHCFIDGNKRVVSLKKKAPEFHELFLSMMG